jgi:hypothetical protein
MRPQLLPPNVVIIGSWRCGTTLMFFSFSTGFKDVESSYEESYALETWLPPGKWRVSKKPNDAHIMTDIIDKIDPYFIALIRDPRDAIRSWKAQKNDYHLDFKEWQRNQDCIEQHMGPKVIRIRYEDLVKDPNGVQLQMCARIPGLEIKRKFSECHTAFPQDSSILWQLDGVRPMEPSRIGIWQNQKSRIREQLEQHPEMQSELERYGYEHDSSWQELLYGPQKPINMETSWPK